MPWLKHTDRLFKGPKYVFNQLKSERKNKINGVWNYRHGLVWVKRLAPDLLWTLFRDMDGERRNKRSIFKSFNEQNICNQKMCMNSCWPLINLFYLHNHKGQYPAFFSHSSSTLLVTLQSHTLWYGRFILYIFFSSWTFFDPNPGISLFFYDPGSFQ